MATAFSTSEQDAITRVIHVQQDQFSYEIQRTVDEIIKGDYKRIALQFPDELLHDSVPIYRHLKSHLGDGRELYVLADTSYGRHAFAFLARLSCCVDEVAAQHVDADAMVHYGHACMSLTSRLPVIYVFGKKTIDIDLCVQKLVEAFDADIPDLNDGNGMQRLAILLKHDVVFTHQADAILEKLQKSLDPRNIAILYHKIPTKTTPTPTNQHQQPSKTDADTTTTQHNSQIPSAYTTIFYIGSESMGLTNLLMTNASCKIFSFNPTSQTVRLESSRTNKLLMRRYAMVQKAKDADVFGILVGTLGVASYLPLITHLRKLLTKKQKKSYTISVGKLNPAKLANFLEVECFVYVACGEGAVVVGDKEYLRPIITPYELEIALGAGRGWTGEYILDFEKVLGDSMEPDVCVDEVDERSGSGNGDDNEDGEDDSERPVFSLVTGTYRHPKRYGRGDHQPQIGGTSDSQSTVILRNQDSAVAQLDSAAGQFLQQRTYQGLDMRIGQDAPSVLEQGRSGIARGYQDDIDRVS
ncbi:diphthamide biosynthesis protein [Phlegmacium glaucopus]|nr:diphthamide biosynthesis protein [Phlegmacium glaucopus]